MMKNLIAIIISLSSVLLPFQVSSSVNVIYGQDDRYEYFEVSQILKTLSHSTAAQIDSSLIQIKNQNVIIYGSPLYETPIMEGNFAVCRDEKFAEQLSSARCSGFLISPDTLVTAGHCVTNMDECQNFYWVFNFRNNDPFQMENTVSKDDLYKCKSILKQELSENRNGSIDYAVIKLDRPNKAGGLKISQKNLNLNDGVTLLGHPSGLPLKITLNGSIKQIGTNGYISNLDAFGGNSGSAVIDSKTGEVVGILSSGQEDYKADLTSQCARPHKDQNENASEYISSIKQIGNIQ